MERITQMAYERQRMLKYGETHGATKAAIRYHYSRKTYSKWKKRWNGTPESVEDQSRRPHHSPKEQQDYELRLVKRYAKKYGLLVTKATHKTLFEEALLEMGILYHRIRIATPRHNGKVERQHRTDEMRFYKHMRMYSLADGRKQLASYQRASNDYIMTCLNMKSPNQVLASYRGVM